MTDSTGVISTETTSSGVINWKTVLIISGAYTSYNIGAGFASGQEVLQYFGSWGGYWPIVVPLISGIIGVYFCISILKRGMDVPFRRPSDVFGSYGGKYLARFMDVFTMIILVGNVLVMFAGAGATLHQYLKLPVYVGAAAVGVICIFIVWLGLAKLTDVLGYAGIFLIAFIALAGGYSWFVAPHGLLEAQTNLPQYVTDGKVLQAGFAGIYGPIAAGLFYGGQLLTASILFVVALGPRMKNNKEVVACGIGSTALLTIGVYFVLAAVLLNIDYIVEVGAQVPMLGVIANILPILVPVFALVIVVGILSTIIGMLWVIGRRFAEDKTIKQKLIVLIMAVVGICTGSFIPFATMVNYIYPAVGFVGLFLLIIMIVSDIKHYQGWTPSADTKKSQVNFRM